MAVEWQGARCKDKVTREKKVTFKKWQESKSPEDRVDYIVAKSASKRAVARARSESLSSLYDKLETVEGQELIYKLTSSWKKPTQNIAKCLCVKFPGHTDP